MGHRLSRIVTRTGDDGTTGMADGSRLPKHHERMDAVGDVDELNSQIGWLRTQALPADIDATLARVQQELFNLGGGLAMPGYTLLEEAALLALEQDVIALNATLPPLKEFILPGGAPAVAACHVVRAVARRAERSVWRLHAVDAVDLLLPRYLNRLSDWAFVAARSLAQRALVDEVLWDGAGPPPTD